MLYEKLGWKCFKDNRKISKLKWTWVVCSSSTQLDGGGIWSLTQPTRKFKQNRGKTFIKGFTLTVHTSCWVLHSGVQRKSLKIKILPKCKRSYDLSSHVEQHLDSGIHHRFSEICNVLYGCETGVKQVWNRCET